MKRGGKIISKILNFMATLLFGCVAFLFFVLSFRHGGLTVIWQNKQLFACLGFVVVYSLVLAYVIFYLLGNKTIYRSITIILLFLAIVAVCYYALCASGLLFKWKGVQELRNYIATFGSSAIMLFITFQFLQVVVLPVPGVVSVAAGVALFGPLPCAVYSFIGIVIGSLVAFAIGRYVGVKAVGWIVGKEQLERWMQKVRGKDYLILSLMFLLPMFPDDVLCFVAGLSSMTWLYFIVMISITRLISVLTTAYSLDLIPFNTWWGILLWLVIFALVILAFYLVNKYSNQIDSFFKQGLQKHKRGNQKGKGKQKANKT
jgi:uncharacterized membrane protein YdjX (TVP38/TMEM64 family)